MEYVKPLLLCLYVQHILTTPLYGSSARRVEIGLTKHRQHRCYLFTLSQFKVFSRTATHGDDDGGDNNNNNQQQIIVFFKLSPQCYPLQIQLF